ncbi:MAG: adenosylhomocysteinase [Candidatus Hadarchaeales archaeon]
MSFKVKNIDLAPLGRKRIDWAENHMPVLAAIRREFKKNKPLRGIVVGAALHTEAKTAVLVRTLMAGGAEVAITSCNPLSTKDDVAAALAKEGVHVYAWRGETTKDYYSNLNRVLDHSPDVIIDDGADLITLLHTSRKDLLKKIIGGSEETTTGVLRLRAMAKAKQLKFPVIAVNDTPAKRFFDNRFGTAESTLQAIMSLTNTQISGKKIIVIGFGFVGRGIAFRARGLGGRVVVVESDPIKALEAVMEGFDVLPMGEAATIGDIFITATGNINAIRGEHMKKMKDGAILCNAGHFNVEIDISALNSLSSSRRKVLPDIEEFQLKDGRRLYLLSEGRLVNLAGEKSLGHPMEIMDMSFSLQTLCVAHLVKNGRNLQPNVYEVPPEIDRRVAELKLLAYGVKLERLTEEQKKYLQSWERGT